VRARFVRAVAASLLATTLAGCTLQGAFVQDDRLRLSVPGDRDEVQLPLAISWEWKGEPADAPRFAVFVDRAPIAAGRSLLSLAKSDKLCTAQPGCPDLQWFASKGVYVTAQRQVTVPGLPQVSTTNGAREIHTLSVVVLDEYGTRRGEVASSVDVIFNREF
jgi:hypothetical protein